MEKEKKDFSLKGSCLWGMLLFGILLLVDMVTKIAAEEYFSQKPVGYKIEIIPGWINLCITYNRGIAYGIGNTAPLWAKLAVIIATAVLMAALAIAYFKMGKSRAWIRIAIVFIVAGGVGNLIDRVYYRVWDVSTAVVDPLVADGVRDMVDLSRLGFAVCNFADFFICGGAVALVVAMLFFDKDAVFPIGKYKKMAEEEKAKAEAEKAKSAAENDNG